MSLNNTKKRKEANQSRQMICFKIVCLYLLVQLPCNSFGRVIFQKSLVNYQLVPRAKETNLGNFAWEVQIATNSFSSISTLIKAEDELFHYQKIPISLSPANDTFTFTTPFKAQKKEYTCEIYAHTPSGDSVSIRFVNHIVCGDFYVFYGQSNMLALV